MAGDSTPAAAAAAAAAAVAGGPNHPPSLLRLLAVFDATISLLIHELFLPLPRPVLKALEISGDGRFWFSISIALLPFSSPFHFPFLFSLFLGSLLDLAVVGAIKFAVRRPRPVYNKNMSLVVAVDHWSFPSGHSSRVFFIAFFLYLSSFSIGIGDRVVGGVFVWAAATSVSRVLLGRHFVLDVVAGASLGVMEAAFVHRFLKF